MAFLCHFLQLQHSGSEGRESGFRAVDVCVPELLTGGAPCIRGPLSCGLNWGLWRSLCQLQQAVGEQDDLRREGNCNAAATQRADLGGGSDAHHNKHSSAMKS